MPYETRRVVVTATPQDLAVLASLVEGDRYVVHNESAGSRIFLADSASQPTPGDPAIPLPPGGTFAAEIATGLMLWAWCEAGERANLVVGGSTQ